ncbi:MAG TPA: DUF4153 domain-containing protein [Nitrospira sp.]|nr:DUF4153 domain-containing protein [Nitrospira sp.]
MRNILQIFDNSRIRERAILAFAGLLQGTAGWVVIRVEPREPWEQALWFGALTWVLAGGLLFQFASSGKQHNRLAGIALTLAVPFALITYHVVGQLPPKDVSYAGDEFRLWTWAGAGTVAIYILLPYLQIYQRSGRWQFPYPDLYRDSWNNYFLACLGWLYTGIYWTLVWTCAGLFKAIGIDAIQTLITKPSFVAITTGCMSGLGVALAKEHTQTITTLRTIAATLFRSLTPLLVGIVLSFLAALLFAGLGPLWGTKWASAILLALLLLILLFVNAVFQDGEGPRPYGHLLSRGVEATLLSMPILVSLTLYSMGQRISQHGFTPDRYYAVVFAIVLGGYGLGYAWSVLRSESLWLGGIRRFNIALSFVVVVLALLLHTPLMDPLKRSAEDQERRFLTGAVDVVHFDFGTMRFELGQYGQAVLDRMSQLTTHPAHQQITDQLAKLKTAKHKWDWDRTAVSLTTEELLSRLAVFPLGHTLSPDLLTAISSGQNRYLLNGCSQRHLCDLVAGQWDSDHDTEYVFINGCGHVAKQCNNYTVALYDRLGDKWKQVASISLTDHPTEPSKLSRAEVLRAAQEGHLKFGAVQYHCLTAGDANKECDYWGEDHE